MNDRIFFIVSISLGIVPTDSEEVAFKNVDVALFVGAIPRREDMERKDLLRANVKIFKSQGIALDKFAKKSIKVNTFLMSKINLYKICFIRFLLLIIRQIRIAIFWLIMLHRFHAKILHV